MKILLNGYKVEIGSVYSYQTYSKHLCGVIDTRHNDSEEAEAKKRMKAFNFEEFNEYFIAPKRKKRLFSDCKYIEGKYVQGEYSDINYPEEKIAKYWVILQLTCYDEIKNYDATKEEWSSLFVAFNIEDIEYKTIETYLYEYLTLDIWIRESDTWIW